MVPADRLVTNRLAGRTVTPSNACAAPRASSSPSHRPVLRSQLQPLGAFYHPARRQLELVAVKQEVSASSGG